MRDSIKGDRQAAWRVVKALIDRYECSQGGDGQAVLALKCGVSQPTISRLRAGPPDRVGAAFQRLFVYATNAQISVSKSDPCTNALLAAALREVWNGTDEHARALAAIIRATGDATRAANLSS